MKLIFFGGVQGVGKSTLLSWLENKYKNRFIFIDPEELFRRYFYKKRLKTLAEVENLIVSKIGGAPKKSLVIVHWHYAVLRPKGYIPQISFSLLRKIAGSKKLEQVILFSVEASISSIQKRRLKDSQIKRRALLPSAIREEIKADKDFLVKHQKVFSQILGNNKVRILRLPNEKVATSKSKLINLIKAIQEEK